MTGAPVTQEGQALCQCKEKRKSGMTEGPRLVLSPWIKGEPLTYECSLCSSTFLLAEDRSPKEGMAEIWAAFNEHVRQEHSEGDEETSVKES